MSIKILGVKVANVIAYSLSAAIVIIALVFAYTILTPIDVLKDWYLYLPKNTYSKGEVIGVESRYTKLRPVKGEAVRYLECKNNAGNFIRYDVSRGVADRGPGVGTGTGIEFKVPETVVTPAICRFSVAVTYQIYPWRELVEYNTTSLFTIK